MKVIGTNRLLVVVAATIMRPVFILAQKRIAGGSAVLSTSLYPSFVWLGNCGGTLVWPDMVLTASSCFIGLGTQAKIGGTKADGSESEIIDITRKFPHPMYLKLRPDHVYDVMLVQLRNASSAPIQKINEDPKVPKHNDNVTLIGFGLTSPSGSLSPELNEAYYNTIPFGTCQKSYKELLYPQYLCAGGPSGGACPGDGGGPLYLGIGNSTLQIGILNFGAKYCSKPAIYSRTSTFKDWINRIICRNTAYPQKGYC